MSKAVLVVGGAFGDEGKGKVISYLAIKDKIDVAVRGGVGPNAGHTVVSSGKTYKVRLVPSAFTNPQTRLLIGSGVLVNPQLLLEEIKLTDVRSRIGIDYQTGVIEEEHIQRDRMGHLKEKIGTTGTGTGPANADRVLRKGKVAKEIPTLQEFLTDVAGEVNNALDLGKRVLIEGTQGTFLSLYHGTYPYVTSKDTTASAVCADVGIGPLRVGEVIVVLKSYLTRVGEGPLENELPAEEVVKLGWSEFGTVTGRMRRAAPFNFKLAKRACLLNSATQIALTKLDVLFKDDANVKRFQDLSTEAKMFVEKVEAATGVRVTLIGTGPSVEDMIDRRGEV
ncbi:MAG: adenylosuccinate synthetase [Nitrososphaerales archaeon]